MPDLSLLNTVIAMVIVILVLSLIVQSLQTLVKKILKLKSRTILNSLEDLFETINRDPAGPGTPRDPAGPGTPNPPPTTKTPKQLVEDVTERLRAMGRETLGGNLMLDSLAKGDLLKVLTRVGANDLLPGAVNKFQAVLQAITQLNTMLDTTQTALLGGDASAKFAALRASLTPLVHDIQALTSGGNINPEVLLGDLSRLRQIKAADVLDILGQVQQQVGKDLETAVAANDEAQKALAAAQATGDQAQVAAANSVATAAAGKLQGVRGVSDGLKTIAQQITVLGTAFDAAFAPLRERLEQAEVWYDTVMQGFEERHTRHMKTVAIILSIVVVVVLNANFFSVYRAMAADPVGTKVIADQAPQIIEQSRQITGAQDGAAGNATAGDPASSSTNASPTAPPSASPAAVQTPTQGGASPQSSPPAKEKSTTVVDLKQQKEQIDKLVATYKTFGIEPLTREQLSNVVQGKVSVGDIAETLIGWAIMVVLLSAGAPFWQDTLESLFGLKNLLRQKSDTKNVEGGQGGQPKP